MYSSTHQWSCRVCFDFGQKKRARHCLSVQRCGTKYYPAAPAFGWTPTGPSELADIACDEKAEMLTLSPDKTVSAGTHGQLATQCQANRAKQITQATELAWLLSVLLFGCGLNSCSHTKAPSRCTGSAGLLRQDARTRRKHKQEIGVKV